jgi:redox-sensing transcriptional repressor
MNGEMKISSSSLAQMLDITPSQVRADLNEFSGAGVQGYGYSVKHLYTEISRELGVADGLTAVIVGKDTPDYTYLTERLEGRGITVVDLISSNRECCEKLVKISADIAVITDCDDFTLLVDALRRSNIRGVWNMTQKDIELDIPVLNLPVGDIIMGLMCEIRYREKGADEK